MKPLHELVSQHRALAVIDPEEVDEQTLADTLAGLEGEITIKATSCAAYVRNCEAFAETVENAAKQLNERAARIRRKADWLRFYLLQQMKGAQLTKIQSPEFTVSIRKNPIAVHIEPDAVIPPEYMVQPEPPPPRPDKKAIKAALEAGTEVEGCRLEQGERVDIRV